MVKITITLEGRDKTEVIKKAYEFVDEGYEVVAIDRKTGDSAKDIYAVVELSKTDGGEVTEAIIGGSGYAQE